MLLSLSLSQKKLKNRPFFSVSDDSSSLSPLIPPPASDEFYGDAAIDFPHRPPWSYEMSPSELHAREEAYFEGWLRNVYAAHDSHTLNHFEHNLEVWRQLWRVLEMSDVLLILSDARFPSFHFPPSLYRYVTQVKKIPVVLILNKIDLIPPPLVEEWKAYFRSKYPSLRIACVASKTTFTQTICAEAPQSKGRKARRGGGYESVGLSDLVEQLNSLKFTLNGKHVTFEELVPEAPGGAPPPPPEDEAIGRGRGVAQERQELSRKTQKRRENEEAEREKEKEKEKGREEEKEKEREGGDEEKERGSEGDLTDTEETLSGSEGEEEEFEEFSALEFHKQKTKKPRSYVTVGVVGHPNVGKSTLINAIKGKKVCSTSITPGHTKHFQTVHVSKDIRLCDSPGLVFPAVGMPRQLQVLTGLYPIAQVREPYSALGYLAEWVAVEEVYGLIPPEVDSRTLASNAEAAKARRTHPWSAWDIAVAYAQKRHYTTKSGRPDTYRAGNEILRNILSGKLVFYFAPPHAKNDIPLSPHSDSLDNTPQPSLASSALPSLSITSSSSSSPSPSL